jgi:hypothetical protein
MISFGTFRKIEECRISIRAGESEEEIVRRGVVELRKE